MLTLTNANVVYTHNSVIQQKRKAGVYRFTLFTICGIFIYYNQDLRKTIQDWKEGAKTEAYAVYILIYFIHTLTIVLSNKEIDGEGCRFSWLSI